MKAYAIDSSVFCLHADIDTHDLFEGIWPIPEGVSLNSYIVKGEKVALIDLVRDWTGAPKQLEEELSGIGISFDAIDYLVLNHLEPDHTGWLKEFVALNPAVTIVSTAKGIELVKTFYGVTERLKAVKTGDTLDLGGGRVLHFVEAPNVHWPETMVSWEPVSGTLFACDAFGSFGKLGDRVFDDQFNAEEHQFFEKESLRYYANIVSSFSVFVERAIKKLEGLDIKVVAPSHGIVWRKEPLKIVERYQKYASYMNGPAEKEICIVWGSMYGNTKRGLDAVIRGIEAEGVPYSIHRIPNEDVSYVLADAYKSLGLVLAMPTYEYAMFPPMAYAIDIMKRKHIWNRQVLRIGSWGWVGGAKKEFDAVLEGTKWTCVDHIEWPGAATEEKLAELEAQGRALAKTVKELGK